MFAINSENHLLEVIEQVQNGNWVVYDTHTGLFFEVKENAITWLTDADLD